MAHLSRTGSLYPRQYANVNSAQKPYFMTFAIAFSMIAALSIGFWANTIHPAVPTINRMVGALLVVYAISVAGTSLANALPRESLLLIAFIAWAAATGPIVAQDADALFGQLRPNAQMAIAFAAIVAILTRPNIGQAGFMAIIATAVFVSAYLYSIGFQSVGLSEKRITQNDMAVYWNPNGIANLLCVASGSLLMWFPYKRNVPRDLLIVGCLVIFAITLIATSSRKAFIAAIVLIMAWQWFCHREKVLKNFGYWVIAGIGGLGLYLGIDYVMESTVMGQRFEQSTAMSGFEGRWRMYQRGVELFIESPIAGIGLGNYAVLSGFGAYSHSDFIETLVATGIVGVFLYGMAYLTLWNRLVRIRKYVADPVIRYQAGVVQAIFVATMVIGLGSPHVVIAPSWVFLAVMVGFAVRHDANMPQIAST